MKLEREGKGKAKRKGKEKGKEGGDEFLSEPRFPGLRGWEGVGAALPARV